MEALIIIIPLFLLFSSMVFLLIRNHKKLKEEQQEHLAEKRRVLFLKTISASNIYPAGPSFQLLGSITTNDLNDFNYQLSSFFQQKFLMVIIDSYFIKMLSCYIEDLEKIESFGNRKILKKILKETIFNFKPLSQLTAIICQAVRDKHTNRNNEDGLIVLQFLLDDELFLKDFAKDKSLVIIDQLGKEKSLIKQSGVYGKERMISELTDIIKTFNEL